MSYHMSYIISYTNSKSSHLTGNITRGATDSRIMFPIQIGFGLEGDIA